MIKLRADTYLYDTEQASYESGLMCMDKTLAQQQFKEEVDINTIVERFGLTGQVPSGVKVPLEDAFYEAVDYHQAMNAIVSAQEAFMRMPAKVRARFQNDPGEFLDFVHDPENLPELRKLGLAVPEKVAEATGVVPDGGASGASGV